MKNKRWTEHEELVVFSAVAEQHNNLRKAFKECAVKLGRTPNGIKYHWYYVMAKNPKKANIAFMTISKTKININGKNGDTIDITPTKKTWWEKLINIFKR